MDKTLRNFVIFGIISISISFIYYIFLFLPNRNITEFDACYSKCFTGGNSSHGDENLYCVNICKNNNK